jgi:membrane protease YdiL (CAAX protease family)
MQIATTQGNSRGTKMAKLLPLIPLGGLPILPAAVLWFPETDDLSDFRIGRASDESMSSRSHRWIRIGMLVLFAMGLLGMLFGCGGQAAKPTGGQYNVTIMATGAGASSQSIAVQLTVTP